MGKTTDENARGDTILSTSNGSIEWILLTGNRGLIAGIIAAIFAAVFTGLQYVGIVPLSSSQPLFYAYSSLIAGNLTLITVVISINQLFLSRELRPPGELRTQIDNIVEYREGIEHTAGEIAPPNPLGFLRILVESTRQKAQELGGFAHDGVVQSGDEELADVVATVTNQMDHVDTHLTQANRDTFSVLSEMLEANYAWQIYRLRVVRAEHTDDIADVAHETITELIDRLKDIDVSRQYFRSIYLQEELSTLSRYLLYTGLPSVVTSLAALLVLTAPPEGPNTVVDLQVLLPVTLTIGLIPLAILCSFFLRTATVTKLTAATIPFTTPEEKPL